MQFCKHCVYWMPEKGQEKKVENDRCVNSMFGTATAVCPVRGISYINAFALEIGRASCRERV